MSKAVKQRRILIVEDNIDVRALLLRWLADRGFEVDGVSDGLQGFEMASIFPYDLLITDLQMPNAGGFEAIEKLREVKPTLPVMVVSGHLDDQVHAKLDAARVAGRLEKPVQRQQMLDAVGAIFERNARM